MNIQIEGEKEYTLKGWGSKEKGDSSFYQTISFIASDRRWFVVEDGFLAYYKSEKVLPHLLHAHKQAYHLISDFEMVARTMRCL